MQPFRLAFASVVILASSSIAFLTLIHYLFSLMKIHVLQLEQRPSPSPRSNLPGYQRGGALAELTMFISSNPSPTKTKYGYISYKIVSLARSAFLSRTHQSLRWSWPSPCDHGRNGISFVCLSSQETEAKTPVIVFCKLLLWLPSHPAGYLDKALMRIAFGIQSSPSTPSPERGGAVHSVPSSRGVII